MEPCESLKPWQQVYHHLDAILFRRVQDVVDW